MSEEEDDASKTEDASQKKIEDSFKKGQVFSSREISNFFLMLGLTFFMAWVAAWLMQRISGGLAGYITRPDSIQMDTTAIGYLMNDLAWNMLGWMAIPFAVMVLVALIAGTVQRPFVFSAEPLKPQVSRISPVSGFKRIFSGKSFVEFFKGILKICFIGYIIYHILRSEFSYLMPLMDGDTFGLLAFLEHATMRILVAVTITLFFLSMADYLYQRFDFYKRLRMTKQETKDEYKQQEGDPHVKQRLRGIRRERARKRMMADVPKADVIITNPTHFAVALQYDPSSMQAPKLLAKGADKVALRIREIGEEHKIIVVRNPPVARMIYDSVDVDEFIKMEHYKAVAEIIGYVYKLRGKNAPKAPNMSPSSKRR